MKQQIISEDGAIYNNRSPEVSVFGADVYDANALTCLTEIGDRLTSVFGIPLVNGYLHVQNALGVLEKLDTLKYQLNWDAKTSSCK